MGKPVAELERTLTSHELAEWAAYNIVEPFGQPRTDDGFRLLAYALFNANRGKNAKPFEMGEFLKVWEPPQRKTPRDELAEFVSQMDAMKKRMEAA